MPHLISFILLRKAHPESNKSGREISSQKGGIYKITTNFFRNKIMFLI